MHLSNDREGNRTPGSIAWLMSLRQRKVSCKEVKKQIVDYLTSKGADRDLLTDQTKRARKRLKLWLVDS
jgi:hypothetical protein